MQNKHRPSSARRRTAIGTLFAIALVAGLTAGARAGTAQGAPATVAAAPLYGARDLGHAAAANRIDISVVLPYQHAADLGPLLNLQNAPGSAYYHRFLKPAQFRAYFSPSPAAYDAAALALSKSGFTVRTSPNRTVLHATGTAGATEALFRTRIDLVRQADGRVAYANVGPATIPAALAGSRIVNLSSIIVAKTAVSERSAPPSNHQLTSFGGTLFGPDGGFGPAAIAKTEDYPVEYGYRGTNSNVADLIDGTVSDTDVAGFLKYFGIKRGGPRTTTITVDGGCGGVSCFDGFTAVIDAEWVLGVAPNASLFTYEIPSLSNAAIADGFNAIVSDDAVNIVNFSVGACEISGGDLQLAIEPIIAQGAAEGISFESVAFGGANLCGLGIDLPMTPANLDTVTGIGASTAIISNTDALEAQSTFDNSNGGVAATITLPPWQAATPGVNSAGRNVPDLVLPGSVDGTGPSVFYQGLWQGGFSFVNNAPFAGYLATVQQYYGYTTPLGNVAPAIYAVFDKSKYADFSDVTLGNIGVVSGTLVSAKSGYDVASGIGTIKHGYTLAKALGYTPASP